MLIPKKCIKPTQHMNQIPQQIKTKQNKTKQNKTKHGMILTKIQNETSNNCTLHYVSNSISKIKTRKKKGQTNKITHCNAGIKQNKTQTKQNKANANK